VSGEATITFTCGDHRDRAASAQCSECGKTLCDACRVVEDDAVYCRRCAPAGTRRRLHRDLIVYGCLWLLIGVAYVVCLRTHAVWYNLEMSRWVEEGRYWRARALLAIDPTYADAETYGVLNWHPLHKAAEHGRTDFIELFLDCGADPDAPGGGGWRPLHVAAFERQTRAVAMLLEAGANPNVADENGMTPLAWATMVGYEPTIELLLGAGADPCAAGEEGFSALHIAVRRGECALVEEFAQGRTLTAGAVRNGETPLHYAAQRGEVAMVRALAAGGLDLDLRTPWWSTEPCALPEPPDLSSQFLASATIIPMELMHMDERGLSYGDVSALHLATKGGHVDVVAALLVAGADANAANERGRRPLHWAATLGNADASAVLVKSGADANARDEHGRTPLHLAAREGRLEIVKLLVEAGADVTAQYASSEDDMFIGSPGRRMGFGGGPGYFYTTEWTTEDTEARTAMREARWHDHDEVAAYLEERMPPLAEPTLVKVTFEKDEGGRTVTTVYEDEAARAWKQDWERAQQQKRTPVAPRR